MCFNYFDAVQTNVVLLLPPNDSLKKKVNFESLKLTKLTPSVNCFIQRPSVESDKLMFFASSSVFPVAPVLAILSLPARSTRFSLPLLREPSLRCYITSIKNIVCDLELLSFILVEATALVL